MRCYERSHFGKLRGRGNSENLPELWKEPYLYYYRDKDAREIDIVLEHDGILNPIEIKKTANPGTELVKVFELLDKASTPRAKGAVICMKPGLSAIDRDNYIVPVWII